MDNLSLEAQFNIEAAELARKQQERRDRENLAAGERRLAEIEAAEKQKAEERREQEAAALEEQVRTAFFASNTGGTEDDWKRLKGRLIEEEQIRRTRLSSTEAEVLRMKQRYADSRVPW